MKQLIVKLKTLFFFTFLLLAFLLSLISLKAFESKKTIVIGAKNCSEQHILSEMLAQLVERHTDLKVKRCFNLEGTTICFNALKSGTIDTYFEYTGTALLEILKEPLIEGPFFPYLKVAFEEKYDLLFLDPLGFSNQYVLIAREDSGLKKISDIQPNTKLALDPEFAARTEMELFKKHYPLNKNIKLMDQVLLYFSLKNKAIDVISGFSTDGSLVNKHFFILEDDKRAFPSYEAAPLISKKVLKTFPELKKVFALLKNRLTNEQMSQLNYEVEILRKDVHTVVQELLKMYTQENSKIGKNPSIFQFFLNFLPQRAQSTQRKN